MKTNKSVKEKLVQGGKKVAGIFLEESVKLFSRKVLKIVLASMASVQIRKVLKWCVLLLSIWCDPNAP